MKSQLSLSHSPGLTKRYKMKYGFPIFLLLSSMVGSEAKDCSASNGTIKDHRDNVTDVCDYECGYYQCADRCNSQNVGEKCACGENSTSVAFESDQYCCPDNNGTILDKTSSCKFTTSISVIESTQNHCYNDYKSSEVVGTQSYYQCENGQCVEAFEMCRGYPLCEDSSDVKECDQQLRCTLGTGFTHNKISLVSDLTPGHHMCNYSNLHNNGKYDTITREDETDLDILSTKKVEIDYSSIKDCKDIANRTGYLCGEQCRQPYEWCQPDNFVSCGSFTSNNAQLCSNTTFWEKKSCDLVWTNGVLDGLKASVGRRCSGSVQHCIYPWYLSNFQFKENVVEKTCQDKSDQVFYVDQTCTEEQYVQAYNDSVCSGKNNITIYYDFCGSEAEVNGGITWGKVEDIREYLFNSTPTFSEYWNYDGINDTFIDYYNDLLYNDAEIKDDYVDPHNCTGSCKTPGYGCQACTNQVYFHCTKNNTKVCIHPELVCNNHPDCDNAEDENLDKCYEKKIELGTINENAILRCQSKMHETMEIVALVCDGIVECQGDEDEPLKCNKNNTNKILASTVGIILSCYLGLAMYLKLKRKYEKESRRMGFQSFSVEAQS